MGIFSITVEELSALCGTHAWPIVRDVRRLDVWTANRHSLPCARWRDPTRVDAWAHEFDGCDREIVVTCAHGHHLGQHTAAVLRARGLRARFLVGGLASWTEAGLPTFDVAVIPRRDEQRPSRWVTRTRPKIDRIACPWLIRRYIDAEAQFLFVMPDEVVNTAQEFGAIAYDIEGATFTHDGPSCTFDTLIDAFGIRDAGLEALRPIVRGADTARLDLAPEAAGLLALSLGNSSLAGADDAAALALGFPLYDALLAWSRTAQSETHNWPVKAAGAA